MVIAAFRSGAGKTSYRWAFCSARWFLSIGRAGPGSGDVLPLSLFLGHSKCEFYSRSRRPLWSYQTLETAQAGSHEVMRRSGLLPVPGRCCYERLQLLFMD